MMITTYLYVCARVIFFKLKQVQHLLDCFKSLIIGKQILNQWGICKLLRYEELFYKQKHNYFVNEQIAYTYYSLKKKDTLILIQKLKFFYSYLVEVFI